VLLRGGDASSGGSVFSVTVDSTAAACSRTNNAAEKCYGVIVAVGGEEYHLKNGEVYY
jgi:hypothetical protein